MVSLRDVFHIGLVIGPRFDVLAWGCASDLYLGQYEKYHVIILYYGMSGDSMIANKIV
jgi:hypothetical protein